MIECADCGIEAYKDTENKNDVPMTNDEACHAGWDPDGEFGWRCPECINNVIPDGGSGIGVLAEVFNAAGHSVKKNEE